MSKAGIPHRFDFKTIVAGVYRILSDNELLARYISNIHPEQFYRNDSSDERDALRHALSILVQVCKNPDEMKTMSLNKLKNDIQTKDADFDRAQKTISWMDNWENDDDIKKILLDRGTVPVFVQYLQTLEIAKVASDFAKKYQEGDATTAANIMLSAVNRVSELNSVDKVRDLSAGDMQKIIDTEETLGTMNKLYLSNTVGGRPENPIDDLLGGFEQQTLNLILGATGGGKTMLSHHLIERCIEQKMAVFVACLEDREKSFTYKFLANMTGISLRQLRRGLKNMTSEQVEKIKEAQRLFDKYVKVKFINDMDIDYVHKVANDYDLECENDRTGTKIKPMVNIVDYTGHVAAKTGSNKDQVYQKYRIAYGKRKDYALISKKICFDFAQVNREGVKNIASEKPISHHDLAGAFDLSNVCDTIISVNRSDSDKMNHEARLYLSKVRDGADGASVAVKVDFACATFDMGSWKWSGKNIPDDVKKEYGEGNIKNVY